MLFGAIVHRPKLIDIELMATPSPPQQIKNLNFQGRKHFTIYGKS